MLWDNAPGASALGNTAPKASGAHKPLHYDEPVFSPTLALQWQSRGATLWQKTQDRPAKSLIWLDFCLNAMWYHPATHYCGQWNTCKCTLPVNYFWIRTDISPVYLVVITIEDKMIAAVIPFQSWKIFPHSIIKHSAVFWCLIRLHSHASISKTGFPGLYYIILPEAIIQPFVFFLLCVWS